MCLTWRERLAAQPEYRDIATWPFIDVQTLAPDKRAAFLRNQRIVAHILNGARQRDVANAHGLDRSGVSKLMQRCLGGAEDSDPALTNALIPHQQLTPGQRRTPLSTLSAPAGGRGALTALFAQLPALQAALDRSLNASLQHRAEGQNLLPQGFHDEFRRLLREAQWPSDRWPFCERSEGYEALRQYFHKRSAELKAPKPKPTRVVRSVTSQLRVFDEIQIDEQTFDAQGRVDLVLDDIHEPLRLGRISQILMVDKATDCRLGWQICLTQHPSQFDLLALLAQLHAPWQRLELTTPGLAYAPGACLPSALGFPFTHLGPGLVRFDNALCHIAHTVRGYVADHLCATPNLGLIAQPKGRNDVEHAFDLVSDLARRFPSTTGSHPRDPRREARKLRGKPPRVTLRAIEEALSVQHTGHNVKAQARLVSRTPLEVLHYQVLSGWPRLLPDARVQRLNPFLLRAQVPVHWYRHENRNPHVNFEYVRYSGEGLRRAATAKAVIVEADSRDIRELSVYALNGEYLGKVQAPLSWQRYPHSVTTRRRIHQLTKKRRLGSTDLLGGYFAYLLEHRELPTSALELIRVYREFHHGTIAFEPPPRGREPAADVEVEVPLTASGPRRRIPSWNPHLALRGNPS